MSELRTQTAQSTQKTQKQQLLILGAWAERLSAHAFNNSNPLYRFVQIATVPQADPVPFSSGGVSDAPR